MLGVGEMMDWGDDGFVWIMDCGWEGGRGEGRGEYWFGKSVGWVFTREKTGVLC